MTSQLIPVRLSNSLLTPKISELGTSNYQPSQIQLVKSIDHEVASRLFKGI